MKRVLGGVVALLSVAACSDIESQDPETAARDGVCAETTWDQTCTFGQVAEFTADAGPYPSKPIEISVTAPEKFTLPDGPEITGAEQSDNVFFLITLTNLSNDEPWRDPLILEYAVSAGEEATTIYTDGHCCGGEDHSDFPPDTVPPGESVTYREEFSVADVDDVTLELKIEGLAGHSITFTP